MTEGIQTFAHYRQTYKAKQFLLRVNLLELFWPYILEIFWPYRWSWVDLYHNESIAIRKQTVYDARLRMPAHAHFCKRHLESMLKGDKTYDRRHTNICTLQTNIQSKAVSITCFVYNRICPIYKILLRSNQKAIQCDFCDNWTDLKCTKITVSEYTKLGKSNETYFCKICTDRLPKFTDSYFGDAHAHAL
jgi:hypothetical protein